MGNDNASDHDLLIRLESKLDGIIEKLRDIPVLENKVRSLELDCTEIERLDKRVGNLETESKRWDVLNSIGIGIAALVGFVFK